MPPVATLEAVLTLQKQAYEQGLKQAQASMKSAAQSIAKESNPVSDAWGKIGGTLATAAKVGGAAMVAAGAAATAFGVSSVMAAARVQEMDAALAAIAKQTGISKAAMDQQVRSIKEVGITTGVAQNLVAQFARANLDMASATKLAKVAQDAAILTQQDSSQVLQDLLHGLQTGNTQLDVFQNLNINAGQAVAKYAESLGKAAGDLTQTERQQALLNAVLEAGKPIAGTYAAAMEEPGKVMRSFPRYITEIQESVGAALLPAFKDVIMTGADLLKTIGSLVSENGALRPVIEEVGRAVSDLVAPLAGAAKAFTDWLKGLDKEQVQGFVNVLRTAFDLFTWIAPPILAAVVAYKAYTAATTALKLIQTALIPVQALLTSGMTLQQTVTNVLTAAQWALNAALTANPIGLIVVAVAALAAAFVIAYVKIEPFRNLVNAIGAAIFEFAKNAIQWIGDFVQKVVGFFQWLWDTLMGHSIIPDLVNGIIGAFQGMANIVNGVIKTFSDAVVAILTAMKDLVVAIADNMGKIVLQLFQLYINAYITVLRFLWTTAVGIWTGLRDGVVGIVTALWDTVRSRFQTAVDGIRSMLQGWADTVKGIFTGVRDAVGNIMTELGKKVGGALNWVIDRVNDFIGLLRTGLGKFGITIPADWKVARVAIPAMARGGIADRPTLAGEAGREAVIPFDPRYRRRAEELWKFAGKAMGFFGAMGGPGGAQGEWWRGSFPMTQGPGGGFSHANLNAWDYAMPTGTAIYLGLPGMVLPGPGDGYGTSIGVNLDKGGSVILGHLRQGPLVQGRVDVGTLIGYSDNTGNSTGPHMHFELRGSSLQPGAGGGGGGGLNPLDIVGGFIQDLIARHAAGEPEWMKGVLQGVIGGRAADFAKWIGDNAKSLVSGVVDFVGDLAGAALGRATPAQLHKWMDQIGFRPAGGTAWADKIVGRESGWILNAIGPQWNGDGGSRGLWQIQPGAWPQFDKQKLFDGLYNTQAAQVVYRQQGPNAWSTNYDTGGPWPSGTWGYNGSGRTETVLTGQQTERLMAILEGDRGRPVQVTINIQAQDQSPQELAQRVGEELELRARYGWK